MLVPKSRQVSASWLFVSLYLWEAIFFPSRLTFMCSKKEGDAEALCERAHFMFSRLAPFFQDYIKIERTHCNLKFSNRSQLKGIPQGAEQVRSYTLSGLLIDEAVYVNELSDMLMAALPAIGRHGRVTIISSAGPSTFSLLCFDNE